MVNSAIFQAADISTLSTDVSTVLVGLVGVSLLFVAYRYLRKAGIR
jgi:hypothetical protein